MTVYFVSRHPGAHDWAAAEGIAVDCVLQHLDPALIHPGDTLIGSLPVNLAAQVCASGARYLHLSLELPAELRGRELSAAQMRECGACLEEFRIERLAPVTGAATKVAANILNRLGSTPG
jgi:CRISPR-associated protein Csx16